jgi:hypothetical protein
MPLLDHFHGVLNQERRWKGFHSYWASAIVGQLSKILPPRYYAEPEVTIGIQLAADVGTLDTGSANGAGNGHVATLVYSPPKPSLVFPVDFAGLEHFGVQVFVEEGGLRLVAAIELVSPANKDRPAHREAFLRKCATYLQEGVSLMIVDVVSGRSGNFHAALVHAVAPGVNMTLDDENILYAAAYRNVAANNQVSIESWAERLQVGRPLPTLPLWLDVDLAVPVDLEQTYQLTCDTLRIRVA